MSETEAVETGLETGRTSDQIIDERLRHAKAITTESEAYAYGWVQAYRKDVKLLRGRLAAAEARVEALQALLSEAVRRIDGDFVPSESEHYDFVARARAGSRPSEDGLRAEDPGLVEVAVKDTLAALVLATAFLTRPGSKVGRGSNRDFSKCGSPVVSPEQQEGQ